MQTNSRNIPQQNVSYIYRFCRSWAVRNRDAQNQANRGQTNPNKFGWNRTNWAKRVKIGKYWQKEQKRAFLGKNRTKIGQKTGKIGQKTGKQKWTLGKQGKTKSFTESRFGFAHPWSETPLGLSSLVNKRFAGGQHPFLDGSCLCHQFFESKASQIFFCKCLYKLKSILLG